MLRTLNYSVAKLTVGQLWIVFCCNSTKDKTVSDSIMLEKAKDFAVNLLNICNRVKDRKKESILTVQLIRSGTSIGANIHESKYAQSSADFVSKMQIALKECYESEYWLELLNRTGYLENEQYKKILNDCGQIRRMLISSINTVKENS